jgi:DNA-binding response OmpR family regulator
LLSPNAIDILHGKWQLSVSSSSNRRLLTRERLLDEAWGAGIAVTDRMIDKPHRVTAQEGRDGPTAPRYLSVRGVGYRFDG